MDKKLIFDNIDEIILEFEDKTQIVLDRVKVLNILYSAKHESEIQIGREPIDLGCYVKLVACKHKLLTSMIIKYNVFTTDDGTTEAWTEINKMRCKLSTFDRNYITVNFSTASQALETMVWKGDIYIE